MNIHKVKQLDERTWHIDELNASMYLIAGNESALLVDAAYGAGDIREVVRSLTDLPYRVVITHAHPDHIGGIGLFSDIWMHRADIGVAATTPDLLIEKTARQLENYDGPLHSLHPGPRFHGIAEGCSFNLGGRVLSVCELPGHTYGSIGLVDEADKAIYSGDACNPNQLMALPEDVADVLTPGCGFTSVRQYLHTLEKIRDLPVDKIYTGHLNELGFMPADKKLTEELIECCRTALEKQKSRSAGNTDAADALFEVLSCGNTMLSYSPLHIDDDWVIC